MTLSVNALAGTLDFGKDAVGTPGFIRMGAIIGLLGGLAERLVPNLVQAAADKMGRAGTPGQAAQAVKARSEVSCQIASCNNTKHMRPERSDGSRAEEHW